MMIAFLLFQTKVTHFPFELKVWYGACSFQRFIFSLWPIHVKLCLDQHLNKVMRKEVKDFCLRKSLNTIIIAHYIRNITLQMMLMRVTYDSLFFSLIWFIFYSGIVLLCVFYRFLHVLAIPYKRTKTLEIIMY